MRPLPLCALQYFCVNASGLYERSRDSCPGFPPDHEVSYEQVRGVAAEPWEWRPMRGGLGGNKEFEIAEIEALSVGSQWVSLLGEGTLGRNNALRLDDARRLPCEFPTFATVFSSRPAAHLGLVDVTGTVGEVHVEQESRDFTAIGRSSNKGHLHCLSVAARTRGICIAFVPSHSDS